MNHIQYGSFEIQSPVMQNLLNLIGQNTGKKFFIVVGDAGSGKTLMVNYINKVIFNNSQQNIFEDVSDFTEGVPSSAIVSTSKESAYEVKRNFLKNRLLLLKCRI